MLSIFVLLISLPSTLCRPIEQRQLSKIDVQMPFSNFFGFDPLSVGNPKAPRGQTAEVNLPFADVALPLEGLFGTLLNRPVAQVNGGQTNGRPPIGGSNRPPKGKETPFTVINAPFAQFAMPLSHVTEERQPLPDAIQQKVLRQRQMEAKALQEKVSITDPFGRSSPLDISKPVHSRPVQSLPAPNQPVISNIALNGNLDSILNTKGPKKGSPEYPFPNKLTLPLSIMDMPLSLLDMPLSKLALPFSHFGSLPQGLSAANVANSGPGGFSIFGKSDEKPQVEQPKTREDDFLYQKDCPPTDLVCQATAALQPPLAVNLNSFAMPYSFLNTPLGFFNLPLSYVNLPYGSFNLPFGHMNMPFSFLNLPLFELQQTFGSAGAAALRSESVAESQLKTDRQSPIEHPDLFVSPTEPAVEAEEPETSQADIINQLFAAISNASEVTNKTGISVEKPSDAMKFADKVLGEFGGMDKTKKDMANDKLFMEDIANRFGNVFRQAVPAIPDMGGLFGTPFSLFTTPFSLFNLPLGFTDLPLAFVNLPMSHFNLPLSHMTMPFAGFALPTHDIKTPELYQTVHNSTTELSDIPPSLLEILDPEDPLNSYLNLPLAEMNMPLAVMDMPFTVFDMPFAFLNLPLSHLSNPLTHLHLPFEISSLPFAELALPFEGIL